MYDFCVVGSGIIGKYLAHQLRGKNCIWISSNNKSYTSTGEYHLEQLLGQKDTWQEKATGLVSFPTKEDISLFPFSWSQYKHYELALKQELKLKSLAPISKQKDFKQLISELESIFPTSPMHYFWSGYQPNIGPNFAYRKEYEEYWKNHRPHWDFSEDHAESVDAQYLLCDHGQAKELIGKDSQGKIIRIQAKHFILAGNTPGNLTILEKTFAENQIAHRSKLGRYFADHAQSSLGILLPNLIIPRTTIATFCYQDRDWHGIPYRLEFHIAPPRKELIQKTRTRLPQFSENDFVYSFLRVALVYHSTSSFGSRLQLQGRDNAVVSTSEIFHYQVRALRNKLLPYVLKQFFADKRLVLLNQHFPVFFGGHLTGGISYPNLVDDHFSLYALPNVSIAGSAVFPTSGLFNPTFTSLVCAKHLLSAL